MASSQWAARVRAAIAVYLACWPRNDASTTRCACSCLSRGRRSAGVMCGELPARSGRTWGRMWRPPQIAPKMVANCQQSVKGTTDAFAIRMVITIPREAAAAVEYDPVYAEFLAALVPTAQRRTSTARLSTREDRSDGPHRMGNHARGGRSPGRC